jgi:hypothetical protein
MASSEFDLYQNRWEVRCMNYNNIEIPAPLCMVAGAVKLQIVQYSSYSVVHREH